MSHIISAIKAAGYDPYTQLCGYVHTGNVAFITRSGNAREMVQSLDRNQLKAYVLAHEKSSGS